MRRTIFDLAFSSIVLLFGCGIVSAEKPANSSAVRISKLIAEHERKKTFFSIHFCDAADGRPVFSHNPDSPLTPASNMKLLTTAAAIDLLGVDFEYKTTYGLLADSMVIVASGDPLLADPVIVARDAKTLFGIFDRLIAELRAREITLIEGDLLIDDTIFDEVRFHPSWPIEQANKWYAAEVTALSFNNNCIDLTLTPGVLVRQPVAFAVTPPTEYVRIANECLTRKTGANTSWAARQLGTNQFTLKGEAQSQQTIYTAIERPSAFHGYVLAEYLLKNGIRISGKLVIRSLSETPGRRPSGLDVLLVERTPLKDVIWRCNSRSLNLAAECLFKTLGAYYGGAVSTGPCGQGSWSSGKRAVESFLSKVGIESSHYKIDDGCGLSHENRLSARSITAVLTHMYRAESSVGDMYRRSLARPNCGTLAKRNRFAEPQYSARIFAKTGYVTGVRALSGYCQTAGGRWLAFSILANHANYTSTAAIDQIVKEMIE